MELEDAMSISTLQGVFTLLSLLVHKPSPLLLKFNGALIEVVAIHLSPELEVIAIESECFIY